MQFKLDLTANVLVRIANTILAIPVTGSGFRLVIPVAPG